MRPGMPLPEQVCGSAGAVSPLPAAGPCPAAPPLIPAAAVGAIAPAPAVLDPGAPPLDMAADEPPAAGAVAEPAAPLLVGALPGFVVVALAPAVEGLAVALEPAVALDPAVAADAVEAVAGAPLAPVPGVCESSEPLEQAGTQSASNAEETSIPRAKVGWLAIIDILLSSRVRHPNSDESRIGGRALKRARRNTFNIDAP